MSAGTWVLVADAGRARLLAAPAGTSRFEPLAEHPHPAGRQPDQAAERDRAGRLRAQGDPHQGHAAEPREDAQALANERFARELTEELETARRAQRYDRLYVVAPPRMLGTLRRFYGAQTQRALREEINRDLSTLDGPSLAHQLARLIPR